MSPLTRPHPTHTLPHSAKMDAAKTKAFVDKNFDDVFVKVLSGFVEIPNLTPGFDEHYFTNGHIVRA